ncbi:MAG: hypothetical protein AAF602_00565 [Myxococcota bacterium]
MIDSVLEGTNYGIESLAGSTAGASLTITGNRFRGSILDANFDADVDTQNNDWSDAALLDLIDSDGDGFAECGADFVYSSTDYGGTVAGAANTSTATSHVSDSAPVTGTAGVCPP